MMEAFLSSGHLLPFQLHFWIPTHSSVARPSTFSQLMKPAITRCASAFCLNIGPLISVCLCLFLPKSFQELVWSSPVQKFSTVFCLAEQLHIVKVCFFFFAVILLSTDTGMLSYSFLISSLLEADITFHCIFLSAAMHTAIYSVQVSLFSCSFTELNTCGHCMQPRKQRPCCTPDGWRSESHHELCSTSATHCALSSAANLCTVIDLYEHLFLFLFCFCTYLIRNVQTGKMFDTCL